MPMFLRYTYCEECAVVYGYNKRKAAGAKSAETKRKTARNQKTGAPLWPELIWSAVEKAHDIERIREQMTGVKTLPWPSH